MKLTQKQQVTYDVLSDGEWHNHTDPRTRHQQVYGLKKKGFQIETKYSDNWGTNECDYDKDVFVRLVK